MAEVSAYSLEQFGEELERLTSREEERAVFLEEAQVLLKKFLPNQEFVCHVLEKMVDDGAYLREKIGTIDRNDIMLHLSPGGSFSMRLFVWLPSIEHPIHDHGSWGVVGGYTNKTQEIKYRRLDDGTVEGYARLEEKARGILNPGDTTYVLPFDIHQMSSCDDQISLTVHVYGKPIRSGFVRCFNCRENSTYLLITPGVEKCLFAVRALGAIGGDIAKSPLEKAFRHPHPLVRSESLMAMEKVDKDASLALLKEALSDVSEEVKRRARAVINQQ